MKKILTVVSSLALLMTLTACSTPTENPDNEVVEVIVTEEDVTDEQDAQVQEEYTGLTVTEAERQAQANGTVFRVVEEDGESLPVTMDFRPGRINASVENEMVVSYEVEGEGDTMPEMTGYTGLTTIEAEEQATIDGVPFRVVMEDGEPLPTTRDFRPGRINATVESGIVVSYEVEGE